MFKLKAKKISIRIVAAIFFIIIPAYSFAIDDKEIIFREDLLLTAMQTELKRAKEYLNLPEQPKPYFVSFLVQEISSASIAGENGAVTHMHPDFHPYRVPYVQVRVGSYEMDNANLPLTSNYNFDDYENYEDNYLAVPIEGNGLSLRVPFWLASDTVYKKAIADYQKKKVLKATAVEIDKISDFSKEKPAVFISPIKKASFDKRKWGRIICRVTGYLASKPEVINPAMKVESQNVINYFVNTEGTIIRTSEVFYRIYISAYSRASDGIRVDNFRNFFVRDIKELPDEKTLFNAAREFSKELSELSKSEELKPYTGPAILTADVAGVFFHEALGHRLEGERQRAQESGQTFKEKIGEKIIPEFLSVIDDPSREEFGGKTLTGFYSYDEEGAAGQKVVLVERGILKNYLMSRTPIKGFNQSNGHGRLGKGFMWQTNPAGRMANLIVESEKKLSWQELKSLLIEEAKQQGKPYGLIIKHVESGETNTRASKDGWRGGSFQVFKATPVLVYKVDVETGEEKLVRGVEVVGTPLVSLEKIIATGDDFCVFNGMCGAESGYIPVSTVSPSILTKQVEVQRIGGKPKKAPILPSPFSEK